MWGTHTVQRVLLVECTAGLAEVRSAKAACRGPGARVFLANTRGRLEAG